MTATTTDHTTGPVLDFTDVDVRCPAPDPASSAPAGTTGQTMSPHHSLGGSAPPACDPILTITVGEERFDSVDVRFTSDGSIL